MGIKHFWHWYKSNFGEYIKNLRKHQDFKTINVSIDNLMIDLNGVFHNSTQKVYQYGNCKPQRRLLGQDKRKKMGGIQQQKKVFADVCSTIESLFSLVEPNKRLILCIDGPAPLSKQNQQRQRRFRSAMEKDDEEFTRFDGNSITPGTKFMDYLSKYIDWYIKKRITESAKWQQVEIIFSNEKSPGEGEHKIINYIRKYGNAEDSFCIHGLDADLIMLALGTHLPNFWILREDMYDYKNEFFVLDIGQTRKKLSSIMSWVKEENKEGEIKFNPEYSVNDFIFICFMVGNDFLPHIPSIEIIEGGIDFILDVYKNVGERYGHLTSNKDGDIVFQKKPLEVFMGTISQYNKGILEDKLMKKDKFFPDILLENSAKIVEGKYVLDIDKYKKDYYKKCFADGIDIKKLCHEYLEGMQWVLSYYTRGVPDWKWCFKNHYAPFAHELAEYIGDFKFPDKRETEPSKPFQQLLSVIPPKSYRLIPIPICQLLTNKSSPIKKFCPDKFEVDISGKRREWEGIVLLPMVDFDVIEKEYTKHIYKVDKRDLVRNKLGKSFIYKYDNSNQFLFRSYYGNIDNCCVAIEMIDI